VTVRPRSLLLALVLAAGGAVAEPRDAMTAAMAAMLEGNFAEAYCLWQPLAERGDAEAQYHLGWLYANGNGLKVDTRQAVAWWRRAAEQGHADAEFAMGLAATTGDGMERDLNEAVRWYGLAAQQGHQDARDILLQLAADPAVRVLEQHPEFVDESWFGWHGEVVGERVNVRAGPGTANAVIGQLDTGAVVRVIARTGSWLRVVPPADWDRTKAAWIHAELVGERPPD
jgi:hypothetical protein